MKERHIAICACGKKFFANVLSRSFGEFIADRHCPGCLSRSKVREIVFNVWWARLLHWLGF